MKIEDFRGKKKVRSSPMFVYEALSSVSTPAKTKVKISKEIIFLKKSKHSKATQRNSVLKEKSRQSSTHL